MSASGYRICGRCVMDTSDPTISFEDWAYTETRFKMLTKADPEGAKVLAAQATEDFKSRWEMLKYLAAIDYSS